MKRSSFMAVAAALVLQPIQANATQADGKSELANMNALYEYAWSLDYPQQATYDNILEKTESGAAQAVNMLPSAALGYQIKDYDGTSCSVFRYHAGKQPKSVDFSNL